MASKHNIDPTTLQAFGAAAAGHDGVLSDPTGELVIKPCTQAEISFYESVPSKHPALAEYMPTFYGTLALNKDKETATATGTTAAEAVAGTAATLAPEDVGPMRGRKLETELSIVLENITAGFKHPNIMDLKLGARLYDDDTKPEKRARLDKVAENTTSKSLGFRVAGMRVWQGGEEPTVPEGKGELIELDKKGGYRVYNKLWGRVFNEKDIIDGFEEFFVVPGVGVDAKRATKVVSGVLRDVKKIVKIFEGLESRMYSASILVVYEGDPKALDAAHAYVPSEPKGNEDDDEDEEVGPKDYAVKLIDFAHASWTPGLGPDENALQGMRATVKLLEELLEKLKDTQ